MRMLANLFHRIFIHLRLFWCVQRKRIKMSKHSVYVLSAIPNLLTELRLSMPSLTFSEVGAENSDILKEAELIIGDADLMSTHLYNSTNLKWLQLTWAGVNKLTPYINKPLPFVMTRFSGTVFGQMMSEYVIANIVRFERDFRAIESEQKNGIWRRDGSIGNYRVISDLTIGILGLGTIGKFVGKYLHILGAKVLGYGRKSELDPAIDYLTPDDYFTKSNLSDFLSKCDYIINILPSTPETDGLLNGDVLKNCEAKSPAFINVGRGTIITESDLVKSIKNGWISRAILDVFEVEPLPKHSVLWKMKEVEITPHVSADTFARHIAILFKNNYQLYMSNEPLPFQFDYNRGY